MEDKKCWHRCANDTELRYTFFVRHIRRKAGVYRCEQLDISLARRIEHAVGVGDRVRRQLRYLAGFVASHGRPSEGLFAKPVAA